MDEEREKESTFYSLYCWKKKNWVLIIFFIQVDFLFFSQLNNDLGLEMSFLRCFGW
jgi:hypothetical protein